MPRAWGNPNFIWGSLVFKPKITQATPSTQPPKSSAMASSLLRAGRLFLLVLALELGGPTRAQRHAARHRVACVFQVAKQGRPRHERERAAAALKATVGSCRGTGATCSFGVGLALFAFAFGS